LHGFVLSEHVDAAVAADAEQPRGGAFVLQDFRAPQFQEDVLDGVAGAFIVAR